MFVSVITCTRNREASLKRLLDSFVQMSIPPDIQWEMIIVDNGSTDGTPALIATYVPMLPIRREYEPQPGVSNARNKGVAVAKGDYIIWTDDDCDADADFLAAYVRAFRQFPDAALFGGRIIPRLAPPSPAWFVENMDLLEWLVAKREFGDEYLPLSITEDRLPFGANSALRTAEQRRFLYNAQLGVKKSGRLIGEETEVYRSLLNAGGTGYWVPDSRINHNITPARQTKKYVRDYFWGHGEYFALTSLSAGRSHMSLLMHHGPRAAGNFFAYYLFKALFPSRLWVRRLVNFGTNLGVLGYVIKDLSNP